MKFHTLAIGLCIAAVLAAQTVSQNPQVLWFTSPAVSWSEEALPIGNGFLGGMIFGNIAEEHIQYNEKTLWKGGPGAMAGYQGGNVDGAASHLGEVRARINVQDWDGADALMKQYLVGNKGAFGASQAFGDIYISTSADSAGTTNYRRELDLDAGVARVQYTFGGVTYKREYFCSYPDKAMVMLLTSSGKNALTCGVRATCAHADSTIVADAATKTIVTTGKVSDNKMGFESRIKVVKRGGTLVQSNNTLQVTNADSIMIIMTAATQYRNVYPTYTGNDYHAIATANMNGASAKTWQALLASHQADYKKLYDRVKFNLNDAIPTQPTNVQRSSYTVNTGRALEVLLFQYGRYLLIASSREGTLPAHLQGVWNMSNSPRWNCDYHLDVNLEMNYWSAEVTNLTECSVPLVDFLESLRAPGRVTVEKHYGITGGGWIAHPMVNAFGFTAPGWETQWGWAPFDAPWICQGIWQKYKFTGDTAYLRTAIYPIIRDQAYFWTKWLIPDKQGYLVSSPSVSPEHGRISDGPTSDQSMCYELFSDVIEASQILNVDADFRKVLIAKRDSLLPLKIGSFGQLQEWKYDWDDKADVHRHLSHLVSVYEGERINPYTNPAFAKAAGVSLATRDAADGAQIQGWSQTQRIGLWARLLNGENAFSRLRTVIVWKMFGNLFSFSSATFQIDANLGLPAMMSEMLLQSHMPFISLLPALPSAWPKGSVSGLCARTGFVVAMSWNNGSLTEATITSKKGYPCVVKSKPFAQGGWSVVNTNSSTIVPTSYRASDTTLSFATVPGVSYRIARNASSINAMTSGPGFANATILVRCSGGFIHLPSTFIGKECMITLYDLSGKIVGKYHSHKKSVVKFDRSGALHQVRIAKIAAGAGRSGATGSQRRR